MRTILTRFCTDEIELLFTNYFIFSKTSISCKNSTTISFVRRTSRSKLHLSINHPYLNVSSIAPSQLKIDAELCDPREKIPPYTFQLQLTCKIDHKMYNLFQIRVDPILHITAQLTCSLCLTYFCIDKYELAKYYWFILKSTISCLSAVQYLRKVMIIFIFHSINHRLLHQHTITTEKIIPKWKK